MNYSEVNIDFYGPSDFKVRDVKQEDFENADFIQKMNEVQERYAGIIEDSYKVDTQKLNNRFGS